LIVQLKAGALGDAFAVINDNIGDTAAALLNEALGQFEVQL
jgi:hypothetical protein